MTIKEKEQLNYKRIKGQSRVVFIRISDGVEKIYNFRYYLANSGFEFNKRSYGNSFYEKKTVDGECEVWEHYARDNRLRIDIIPEEYTRSTDYRETFFKTNKPVVEAKYRCAYCGRKVPFKDITVDHVFPINKLSYEPSLRKRAARMGINGANETKNLVAACRSCNSKKGTKTGVWIYKGFLGRSEKLWKVRKTIRFAIIFAVIIAISYRYYDTQKPNTFASSYQISRTTLK